jgi:hypothetical protein
VIRPALPFRISGDVAIILYKSTTGDKSQLNALIDMDFLDWYNCTSG